MAVFSYVNDNGTNERIYVLRFDLQDLDAETEMMHRTYFLEGYKQYLDEVCRLPILSDERQIAIEKFLREIESKNNIFITLKVPKILIDEIEEDIENIDEDAPLKFILDEGRLVELDEENYIERLIYEDNILSSFDQEHCYNTYAMIVGKREIEYLDNLQRARVVKPRRKLRATQAVLLRRYFREVFELKEVSKEKEAIIISLAFDIYPEDVRKANVEGKMDDKNSKKKYTQAGSRNVENIKKLWEYINDTPFNEKQKRNDIKKLKEAMNRDLVEMFNVDPITD